MKQNFKFILVFLFLALTMSFVSAALTDGLKGYWNFDEAAGTTLTDSLGFYNGTTTGATVNQPGKINKSYYIKIEMIPNSDKINIIIYEEGYENK